MIKQVKLEISAEELTNTTGLGKILVVDKCNEAWYEEECPNKSICGIYHYGQFGHKIVSLMCEECYNKPDPIDALFNKTTVRTLREDQGVDIYTENNPAPKFEENE